MNYQFIIFFILGSVILSLLLFPVFASAEQGLVPCGTSTTPPCQPCHIFVLAQNLLNFVWKWIAIPLATLMLVYGGFLMIVPGIGGEKSAAVLTKGKKVITNALVGIIIIFFAWLLIDTIIKLLVDPTSIGSGKTAVLKGLGPWNEIECKIVPTTTTAPAQPAPQKTESFLTDPKQIQETVLGTAKVPQEAITKQALNLFKKYPESFSTKADCGENNNADGTLQAVAQGQLPPVCAPGCSTRPLLCKPGGVTGNVNLDSRLLNLIDSTLGTYKGKIQITSLTTGEHGADSQHYQGRAADIKITDSNLKYSELYAFFFSKLGPNSFVQCEIQGQNSACGKSGVDHIHVQYNR